MCVSHLVKLVRLHIVFVITQSAHFLAPKVCSFYAKF